MRHIHENFANPLFIKTQQRTLLFTKTSEKLGILSSKKKKTCSLQ